MPDNTKRGSTERYVRTPRKIRGSSSTGESAQAEVAGSTPACPDQLIKLSTPNDCDECAAILGTVPAIPYVVTCQSCGMRYASGDVYTRGGGGDLFAALVRAVLRIRKWVSDTISNDSDELGSHGKGQIHAYKKSLDLIDSLLDEFGGGGEQGEASEIDAPSPTVRPCEQDTGDGPADARVSGDDQPTPAFSPERLARIRKLAMLMRVANDTNDTIALCDAYEAVVADIRIICEAMRDDGNWPLTVTFIDERYRAAGLDGDEA